MRTDHNSGGSDTNQAGSRAISRRHVLQAGAATTAAFFAAHATGNYGILQAAAKAGNLPPGPASQHVPLLNTEFDDEPFDPEAIANGTAGWYPSIYGPDDQIGALNEITPQKTLSALQLIKNNKNKAPKTYNLGEIMEPGMPAFGTRKYEQTRVGPGEPFGDNAVVGMEETIDTTYQIATQLDGLPHIAVGDVWYNGVRTAELIEGNPHGANFFGQHLVNPFITRGILLDVLSVKLAEGATEALGEPVEGQPILGNSYRITVEDLQAAMAFGNISAIEPGDVVIIRTGWHHLFRLDEPHRSRYLATEPGIYLREARWLAQFRPAVVGSDTWALEVLPAPEPWSATQFFPVHQELLAHNGIRIGEAFVSEELAADGVYEFLFFMTGQRARWATAANVAPGAIGQSLKGRP